MWPLEKTDDPPPKPRTPEALVLQKGLSSWVGHWLKKSLSGAREDLPMENGWPGGLGPATLPQPSADGPFSAYTPRRTPCFPPTVLQAPGNVGPVTNGQRQICLNCWHLGTFPTLLPGPLTTSRGREQVQDPGLQSSKGHRSR